ncbi:unnamed protein product [Acanthoscelides obtectus]|uniref:Uncharacterized protein n=1 Tax=Acanthoscelides obtectus TaxID=200917 RepID=A0A9P0JKA1_ACAOB|nr:unnamed protein product [Acanthoscelides obtectus]CAK1655068.1 hypothetical protein AOBTE_LOCUS19004 [Acanthoscelides obtectus]
MDQRVIGGLTREMSTEDIKEDLVNQGIADAEVQQMKTRNTKDGGKAAGGPEAGHAYGQLREEKEIDRAQPMLPLPAVRAHAAKLPSR